MRSFSLLVVQTIMVLIWCLVHPMSADEEYSPTRSDQRKLTTTLEVTKVTTNAPNCSTGYVKNETGACVEECGRNGTKCAENKNNKTECDNRHYGYNCESQCACSNYSTCNNTDGSCNCTTPGWEGDLCDQECDSSHFGLSCLQNCTCNYNQTCDPADGTCTCKPGWKGDNCVDECEEGTYGLNCSLKCNCNDTIYNGTCNITTGQCFCTRDKTGHNCTEALVDSSTAVRTNKNAGISSQDMMLIVITSGSVLVVLIVGGSIIYRRKSFTRDNKETLESPAIENNAYDKGNANQCIQPNDTCAEESEMDSSHQQNGVVGVSDDKEGDDKTQSDDKDQESKRTSNFALYEDADLDLDRLSNKSELGEEDKGEDDESPKNENCFQDDEVLYDSADNEDEATTAKNSQTNYNTFEEVKKISLNSTDRDEKDETEEDYNVLEHFNNKNKKMSLKHDDYSSFDQVKSVSKTVGTDQEEENEYDSLNHSPVRKDRAFIIHEQYHHIDFKHNTIEGETMITTSKSKESKAGMKEKVSAKLHTVKDESRLSDSTDVDYTFCEIDDGEVKLDIQEVIYDLCEPDEDTPKIDTQQKAEDKVSENQNAGKSADIVYESCGSSDEDEPGNKAEADIVYESMSEGESEDHDINKIKDTDKKTKQAKPTRRRRSEDYEEFEL